MCAASHAGSDAEGLAAHGTGELAVLRLQKTSRVDHDGDEELALALRQTVLAQSGHAADADAVEALLGGYSCVTGIPPSRADVARIDAATA